MTDYYKINPDGSAKWVGSSDGFDPRTGKNVDSTELDPDKKISSAVTEIRNGAISAFVFIQDIPPLELEKAGICSLQEYEEWTRRFKEFKNLIS